MQLHSFQQIALIFPNTNPILSPCRFTRCLAFQRVYFLLLRLQVGLGALLIRNSNVGILNKLYWGGGTVSIASEKDDFCLFHVG